MEHEYKVGDRVRVVAEKSGHGFEIGDVVTIEAGHGDYKCRSENDYWFLCDDEIEPYIETQEDRI